MSDDQFDKGMAVRKAVLGADYVARAGAHKTDFDADFQRYVTENAWGAVWSRRGLERKTRHMLTLAMLAALGGTMSWPSISAPRAIPASRATR